MGNKKSKIALVLILLLSTIMALAACGGSSEFTIEFLDGETVKTQTVEKGGAITPEEAIGKAGYTFVGWGLFNNGGGTYFAEPYSFEGLKADSNMKFKAIYNANTNTAYKVEHHKETGLGSGEYELADTDNLTGTTDTQTVAIAKTDGDYVNYEAEAITQAVIMGDGSTVVKIKYESKMCILEFDDNGTITTDKIEVGAPIADEPTAVGKAGYKFIGWALFENGEYSDTPFVFESGTNVSGNMKFKAIYNANTNTAYKVEHHKETVLGSGEYELADTDYLTGTTDTQTVAVAKSYSGFAAQQVTQSNINGDGSTVVKIYYTNEMYAIKFVDDGGVVRTLYAAEGDTINELPEASAKAGYTFVGWGLLTDGEYATEAYDFAGNTISASMEFKAIYNANTNTAYKVEHYKETGFGSGEYRLADTDNLIGTTDTQTVAIAKTDGDYVNYEAEAITQAVIMGDDSTVVKIYYNYVGALNVTLSRGVLDLTSVVRASTTIKLGDTSIESELPERFDLTEYIKTNLTTIVDGEYIVTITETIHETVKDKKLRVTVKRVSTAEEFKAATAIDNVFIFFTNDINVSTLMWNKYTVAAGSYESIIDKFNGVMDGDGKKLTITRDADNIGGSGFHNIGFIHELSKDAVIKNLMVDISIGYDSSGTTVKAAVTRVGAFVYQNCGVIKDSYIKAKIFMSYNPNNGRGFMTNGIVYRNNSTGIMTNIITELETQTDGRPSEENPESFGFAVTNQGGTIDKCITVSAATRGDGVYRWMSSMWGTSDVEQDLGPDFNGGEYPKVNKDYDGNEFSYDFAKAKNHEDKNRSNSAIFLSLNDLLVGKGKGDAFNESVFVSSAYSEVLGSDARGWLTAPWRFTDSEIYFGETLVVKIEGARPMSLSRGMIEWLPQPTATTYTVSIDGVEADTVNASSGDIVVKFDIGAWFITNNKTAGMYRVTAMSDIDGEYATENSIQLVTPSTQSEFIEAMKLESNAYILLQANISMDETTGVRWTGSNPKSMISELKATLDGNGHTITITKDESILSTQTLNDGQPNPNYDANFRDYRAHNAGFIGNIRETGAIKNVMFDGRIGFNEEGTATNPAVWSRFGFVAYKNAGLIENCHIKAKVYLDKTLLTGSTGGAVYINTATGTMRSLITEFNNSCKDNVDKDSNVWFYGFAVSNQGGVIDNCITVSNRRVNGGGGDTPTGSNIDVYMGMSSDIGTTNATVDFGPEGSTSDINNNATQIGGYNKYRFSLKGDAGRKNSAIFFTYADLLDDSKVGKTDKFNDAAGVPTYDNAAYADINSANARAWFANVWAFNVETQTITLCDQVVYQGQTTVP